MRLSSAVFLTCWALSAIGYGQEAAKPGMAESATITVLKGLTVPEFEQEMQMFVQALGVNCAFCHVRNNFPADTNEKKVAARQMIEMTKQINSQYFPDYLPPEGN